jgi:hypothetical protein
MVLALRETAGVTFLTAFFMTQSASAIRADPDDITLVVSIFYCQMHIFRRMFHRYSLYLCRQFCRSAYQSSFHNPGNGIGAREYPLAFFPGRRRTANITQLFDNSFDINS